MLCLEESCCEEISLRDIAFVQLDAFANYSRTPAQTDPSLQKKAPVKGKGPASKKKQGHKFVIDCTTAETDSVLETSQFEKFLKEKIKVDGKAGNLGETVAVSRDKSKIVVTAEGLFSKRYLKYLSKKFLKKQQVVHSPRMRDFLRIVSTNKSTYELKYYNIQENDDDAGDE
eukprot:659676-Hanusia_phi.AAC.4